MIRSRVHQLQQKIEGIKEEDTPAMISRLTHYYLRVKRAETSDETLEKTRKELLDSLEHSLANFKWTSSEEEEVVIPNKDDKTKNKGAISKTTTQNKEDKSKNSQEQQQKPFEELVRKLEAALQQLSTPNSNDRHKEVEDRKRLEQAREDTRRTRTARVLTDSNSDTEEQDRSRRRRDGWRSTRNGNQTVRSRQSRNDAINEYDIDYEERYDRRDDENRRRDGRREAGEDRDRHGQRDDRRNDREDDRRNDREDDRRRRERRARNDDRGNNHEDDRRRRDRRNSSEDRHSSEGYHGRNFRQSRRIEHWKLSFSGDNRSTSVESFLYKLKKIADREGVSQRSLLRDIHLILEGQASDWFFTYVDEFEDWDDFEERIRFRFGNPNQDQGIRQRIQERKQQRGESFSAFISEIERLNKMLSKPLSRRRKFEVVWDNMRPHYRSKTSIVKITDLEHLIMLNHRIDAADTSFHSHPETRNPESRNQRNVNQVECATSTDGDEEPEEVDVIDTRANGRGQRSGQRNQPATTRTAESTNQQTGQTGQPQGNVCWNCRKPGHNWRDCKEPRAIFCYGCGELGRTIRSCQRCADSSRGRGRQSSGNQ